MLLASVLFLDWVHLAKTRHSQTEPNRIQAGFAQYYPGCLWKNRTKSESGKLVAGRLSSTRTRPDDFCTVACFQTRCIWPKPRPGRPDWMWAGFRQYDPGHLWKNRTESDTGSWIWHVQSRPILATCWP